MKNTQSKFLKVAIKAAWEAGKIVKEYLKKGFKVSIKKDQTPVTEIDTKVEQMVRKVIKSTFPDHGFLGEEYGQSSAKTKYVWIIDPIDATKNLARKLPFFSTEIGLQQNDDYILGVSFAPMLNKLAFAEKNKGTYLNNKKINVSNIGHLEDSFLSYSNISSFDRISLLKFYSLTKKVSGQRGFGDSWSYHFLAEGKVDIIIEPVIKIWDAAAAITIIKEAGGEVTDLQGKPINNRSTSFLASNKLLHNKVLQYFK